MMCLVEDGVVSVVVVVHVDGIFFIGRESRCDRFVVTTNLDELRLYARWRFYRDFGSGAITNDFTTGGGGERGYQVW